MKILVILPSSGKPPIAFVARTKKELFADEQVKAFLACALAWRYHDGSGWADESQNDSWRLISSVPSKAYIVGV